VHQGHSQGQGHSIEQNSDPQYPLTSMVGWEMWWNEPPGR
jgi:hypothetical protein